MKLPFAARYFLLIVDVLFACYLIVVGFMLYDTYHPEDATALAAVAYFCLGSVVRFVCNLLIRLLALPFCSKPAIPLEKE